MDGVVAAGEALLRPSRWVVPCVGARFDLCVGSGDGPYLGCLTRG